VQSLTPTRKRKRASSSDVATRCGNRLSTLLNNRIVDLIFPSLVLSDEHLESEEARAKPRRGGLGEKAASKKPRIGGQMGSRGGRW